MKWIVGGLILAVVASVVSGRVPVAWVVYSFALMFGCWGLALFFAYSRTKHHGLLLLGITFLASGVAAAALTHWWPLVAGFAASWALRGMGMDPPPPPELTGEKPAAQVQAQAQAQASAAGEDKKN